MKKSVLCLLSVMVSGCSTVKIPKVDFFKLPEYKEAQKDAKYLEPGSAPLPPTDLRSDQEWDAAAREMMQKKDSFNVPDMTEAPSSEDINRDFDALRAKVQDYKKDDPQ